MLQDNIHISDSQYFNLSPNQVFTLPELVEAGKKYPYSLPVQATLARVLKQSKPIDHEKFVKISAVLSPDRQWLYDFLQLPVHPVKKPQETQSLKNQTIIIQEETKILTEESKTLIATPEASFQPLPEAEIPVELSVEPLAVEIDEVALPQPQIPVEDDGNEVIEKVLREMVVEKQVLPSIQPESQPVVKPGNKPEPLIIAKNDLLEREILKEAIDKSIQKEVGEIQVDFVSPRKEESEKEEQTESGFQYWLNPIRKKTESREEKLRKIDALIEKFIKAEPRIVPKKSEFFSPANAAKHSVAVDEDLVSEPLALIFEKQGYFDKAIKAYEKLSLKIPEKRAYFATRIEKIKEIVRNIKNNKE